MSLSFIIGQRLVKSKIDKMSSCWEKINSKKVFLKFISN